MSPSRRAAALALAAVLAACSADEGPRLVDFLPPIPEPTGEPRRVFAGPITEADQLPPGAAVTGVVGDLFLRNERAAFVIQSPARLIGVVPQGGNLVDAVPLDDAGRPRAEDHFGELSMNYLLGRTCEHTRLEVIQDGSRGGVAAILARGVTAPNEYINLKGTGLLPISNELDPDVPDGLECATTYVLAPGSDRLEVYWTLFNPGELAVAAPFAALSDTGGAIETWAPTRGFERLGIESLAEDLDPAPIEYDVFQGPGVAYGLVPVHADRAVRNSAYLVAGVSLVLFGVPQFTDVLTADGVYLDVPAGGGTTARLDLVVGRDAGDVEAAYRALRGESTVALAGVARMASGAPAAAARVALFVDADDDGAIGPDDPVASYLDVGPDGGFAGRLPAGRYLARAERYEVARSPAIVVELAAGAPRGDLALELPDPVRFDFTVSDAATGLPMPARIDVLGSNPAAPDARVFPAGDRLNQTATTVYARRGTSIDLGDGADPPLLLPAGGHYRVIAMHGFEWSFAQADLDPVAGDPDGELGLELDRVIDTRGYLASEYHVHSIGSPDSSVEWPERAASAAASGIEVWASTEHDFVAALQPIVEAGGLARWTRALTGTEVTPFVYGHFIGFPLAHDPGSPSGGAIDWTRGAGGFALLPGEIMDALREHGAEVVQAVHPRLPPSGFRGFSQYFDLAGLTFDYAARTIDGDPSAQNLPNEFLRLEPGAGLWTLGFNVLEVWNNLKLDDTDGDGVRESVGQDYILRDFFNFLSFGVGLTPTGNSDTHSRVRDPVGLPRTMVRVDDDSAEALEDGSAIGSLYDTLTGRAPRDVVVTNGPMIRITRVGDDASVIGREIAGDGTIALRITAQATTYGPFDTLEIFANATPEAGGEETRLVPLRCYTARDLGSLHENDPCALAPLGVLPLAIATVPVGGSQRLEAIVEVELDADDLAAEVRDGATGRDAWIVVRVRGQRGIFPLYVPGLDGITSTLVRGDAAAIDAAVFGRGLPASAFTAPVLVDLDGDGYRAPFAPQ